MQRYVKFFEAYRRFVSGVFAIFVAMIMNDVPLIKKGVFKSYLKNAVSNGAVMGVIFFGILWGKELHWTKALWIGFSSGFALFFIVQMLSFLNNEVLERKKKIKKLNDSVLDAITEVVEFLKKLKMKPILYDEWKTKYKDLDNRMNKINKKSFNLLKNVYKLNKPNTKG